MKIAILGDSVAWGQGLADVHKYANLVAAKVCQNPATDLVSFAHSGAIIGVGVNDNTAASTPEVPFSTPTILEQVGECQNSPEIDLVIIDGGINDVGVPTIIDPFTDVDNLTRRTDIACGGNMISLLDSAFTSFNNPNCKFVVTGYYPILSPNSNLDLFEGVDVLGHLLGLHGLGFPLSLDRTGVIGKICQQAMIFWQTSESALSNAVNQAGTLLSLGGRKVMFVSTEFTESNALFADNPLLFGFNEELQPEDEVIPQRHNACDIQYADPLEFPAKEQCYYASVGHPNVMGAQQITNEILASL